MTAKSEMAAITEGNPALGVSNGIDSATSTTSVTPEVMGESDTVVVCVAAGTPDGSCSRTGSAVRVGVTAAVGRVVSVDCCSRGCGSACGQKIPDL